METNPAQTPLAQLMEGIVELHNDSDEQFKGKWDGKPILIKAGSHRDVMLGVAEHLIERHPDCDLRIEKIEAEETEVRTPVNPLEQTDRGTAFAKASKTAKTDDVK
jgi:hypothetical protein